MLSKSGQGVRVAPRRVPRRRRGPSTAVLARRASTAALWPRPTWMPA